VWQLVRSLSILMNVALYSLNFEHILLILLHALKSTGATPSVLLAYNKGIFCRYNSLART
jgi:hypothetical protein